ncbi:MAG: hypothetical protein D6690_00010 [Nitrospirae bacterium]|nr:MAG: hypothetical protein D6690_00010 [Nitrospirota bacterium]
MLRTRSILDRILLPTLPSRGDRSPLNRRSHHPLSSDHGPDLDVVGNNVDEDGKRRQGNSAAEGLSTTFAAHRLE